MTFHLGPVKTHLQHKYPQMIPKTPWTYYISKDYMYKAELICEIKIANS